VARARRGYCFTRQASGQIVFKYYDELTGRERSRRVPRSIVMMQDAREWVRVHVYGYVAGEAAAPEPERITRLRGLIAGSTNPHERAAAQRALDIALAKMGS
jgi:hypothetical protein